MIDNTLILYLTGFIVTPLICTMANRLIFHKTKSMPLGVMILMAFLSWVGVLLPIIGVIIILTAYIIEIITSKPAYKKIKDYIEVVDK